MDFKVDDVLVSSETTSLSAGSGSIYIAGTQVTEGGADAETVKSLRTSYVCKGFSLEALDDDKYHGLQVSTARAQKPLLFLTRNLAPRAVLSNNH